MIEIIPWGDLIEVTVESSKTTNQSVRSDYPPRFVKTSHLDHELFLHDPVKFSCKAQGSPAPTVTWSHNGVALNPSARQNHFKLRLASLEIREIDVSDQVGLGGTTVRNGRNAGCLMRDGVTCRAPGHVM